ncbi:MAG: hypothetical protein ACRDLB_15625 [Actinomycetota bacterium]
MDTIRWFGCVAGLALVLAAAVSMGKTLIVPRATTSKIAAIVTTLVRRVFLFISNRFETYAAKDDLLVLQGPVLLMAILFTWLSMFFLGYALILWPLIGGFADSLRESGSSLLTLGFASEVEAPPTAVHFIAAANGLVAVALLIAYLPTVYAAFNRRETLVTMLQSRAGSPAWGPEILIRHQSVDLTGNLPVFYSEWERWAADVTETHTTYPVLVYFRSPHSLRSWLIGLLAVMDAAALQLSLNPSSAPTEARLCLRMGFLCLREIADVAGLSYDPDPFPDDPIDLTYAEFEGAIDKLADNGYEMERTAEEAWPHFHGWRVNYESVAYELADLIVAPPGPWSGARSHLPGMAIVPQRPANRNPEDVRAERPRGLGVGH